MSNIGEDEVQLQFNLAQVWCEYINTNNGKGLSAVAGRVHSHIKKKTKNDA